MKGRVVSNKTIQTATVIVDSVKTHPLYGKSVVRTKKYLVDDQIGVKLGDIVEFEKCAPVSKRKHWRISKVVGRDIIAIETEIMKEAAQEAIEEVMPVEAEAEAVEAVEAAVEVVEEAPKKKVAKKAAAKKETK